MSSSQQQQLQLLTAALVSSRTAAARAGAAVARSRVPPPGAEHASPAAAAADGLSARERRRSRAARFGTLAPEHATALPASLVHAVAQWRQDAPPSAKANDRTVRAAHEHLLSPRSPARYAILVKILQSLADRLGPGSSGQGSAGWTPRHVSDLSCGAGEGLWAAARAWPSVASYAGSDEAGALARAGGDVLKLLPDDHPLRAVRASFRSNRSATAARRGEAARTLALLPFALADLPSDASRARLVREAWDSGAHVIVLVEAGDTRGFACIASAREELLALGRGEGEPNTAGLESIVVDGRTYYAEPSPDDAAAKGAAAESAAEGSYVIAPCPHDRPCPLLHDFLPGTSLSSFHGGTSLPTCSFPSRATVPSYATAAQPDDSSRFSYVAIVRGQRPSASAQHGEDMARGAARTKSGILDELRAGPRRLPAQIVDPLPFGEEEPELSPEDLAARQELLALLPQALEREAKLSGVSLDSDTFSESLSQAHDLWADSARSAEQSAADEQRLAESDALEESSSFIEQATGSAPVLPDISQLQADASLPSGDGGLELSPLLERAFAADEGEADDVPSETFSAEDEASMRLEALSWPRLVRPPLKKGGHVTIDACTASGAIERFTLPRSAGRQAYHDARKAAWGDLFPHPEAAKGKTERVPAASDERMPAARGVQRTPTGKKVRRELLSSAAAIGADLVAPRDREGRGGDAEAAARGKNMVGRRAHYSRGAGDARAPRPSRKRSMGDYEIEPEDAEVASEEHVAQQ